MSGFYRDDAVPANRNFLMLVLVAGFRMLLQLAAGFLVLSLGQIKIFGVQSSFDMVGKLSAR